VLRAPFLHWDFHKVYSTQDLVDRAAEDLERFVRELSPIARKVTPWLREVGLGIQDITVVRDCPKRLSIRYNGSVLGSEAFTGRCVMRIKNENLEFNCFRGQ
jgi:hypothetical protein